MSWFYEALVRAEGQPAVSDKPAVAQHEQDGESFLNEIESLSATVAAPDSLGCETNSEAKGKISDFTQVTASQSGRPPAFRHLGTALRAESRLVFHSDPMSMAAEQFRLLRRSLVQAFPRGAVLMITSPGAGDGKTLTAINLCACLADAGDATFLVEADLRRPSMHKVFGARVDPPGVEDALRGKIDAENATHFIDELGFYAAMVSAVPKNPSNLLTGPGCGDLLAWARQRFRWIVCDSAPVMPNADVSELLPAVDAALLVVRAQITPKELSRRALDVLGKRLYGVVLNEATLSSTPYYRYLADYYHPAVKAS